MKIAIISDIHSNLEALNSVFVDMITIGVDKLFCSGDIVGYGPFPTKCLDIVRKYSNCVVMGNHDQGVFDLKTQEDFNKYALLAIRFTMIDMVPSDVKYLMSLPMKADIDEWGISLAHGSYSHPEEWRYLGKEEEERPEEELLKEFDLIPNRICFVGHTHEPFVFGNKNGFYESTKIKLPSDEKFIINVGSVGQPRDNDCRACYGILEITNDSTIFSLRRVFYNIQETEKAIMDKSLPSILAERLYRGV
jgi:predicted phosphodiesterase